MTTKPTTAEQALKSVDNLLRATADDSGEVLDAYKEDAETIRAALQSEREKADGVTVEEFLRAYIDRSDYHTDTEYEFAETRWKIIAEAIMNKFPNGLKIIKGE